MWFEMRREDSSFLQRAPIAHVAEAEVGAARGDVFAALIEPRSWKYWFPNVRDASYASPPPYGVGTIREANVGGTYWTEEIIAWDEDTRWAWTVLRTSVPFATAQVESFELMDTVGGTRVLWTLALEPRLLARLGARFMPGTIRRLLHRAMGNLSTYLQEGPPARGR